MSGKSRFHDEALCTNAQAAWPGKIVNETGNMWSHARNAAELITSIPGCDCASPSCQHTLTTIARNFGGRCAKPRPEEEAKAVQVSEIANFKGLTLEL